MKIQLMIKLFTSRLQNQVAGLALLQVTKEGVLGKKIDTISDIKGDQEMQSS
jgi:hypothetical protein